MKYKIAFSTIILRRNPFLPVSSRGQKEIGLFRCHGLSLHGSTLHWPRYWRISPTHRSPNVHVITVNLLPWHRRSICCRDTAGQSAAVTPPVNLLPWPRRSICCRDPAGQSAAVTPPVNLLPWPRRSICCRDPAGQSAAVTPPVNRSFSFVSRVSRHLIKCIAIDR